MANPELKLPAFEERVEETKPGKRRAVTFAVAAFVTIGGLSLALLLGTLGYDVRRTSMHDARLKGILVQTPTVYQVTEGLKEKAPLVAVVETASDLDEAVATWGGELKPTIREKAAEWPQLRVYAEQDMMYFIYFDDTDIMRDYLYVSR